MYIGKEGLIKGLLQENGHNCCLKEKKSNVDEEGQGDEEASQFSYLWSPHEDERCFEDCNGNEFTINACRTRDTEAIMKKKKSYYRRKYEKEKDDSLVVFQSVEEVVKFLSKCAVKVEVVYFELHQQKISRIFLEIC